MGESSAQLGGVRRIEWALVVLCAGLLVAATGCRKAPLPPAPRKPEAVSADLARLIPLHPLSSDLADVRARLADLGVEVEAPALPPGWQPDAGLVGEPSSAQALAGSGASGTPRDERRPELEALVARNARPSPLAGEGATDGAGPEDPATRAQEDAARATAGPVEEAERDLEVRGRLREEVRLRKGGEAIAPDRVVRRDEQEAGEASARLRQKWLRSPPPPLHENPRPADLGAEPADPPGPTGRDYRAEGTLRLRELEAEIERDRAALARFETGGRPAGVDPGDPATPESAWRSAEDAPDTGGVRQVDVDALEARYRDLAAWIAEDTARTVTSLGRAMGFEVRFGGGGRDCTDLLASRMRSFFGDLAGQSPREVR